MFNIEKVFGWFDIRCQVLHQAVQDSLEEEDVLDEVGDPDVDDEENSESIHDLEVMGEHGIKSLSFKVFAQKQFTEEWNL